ncbi:MAG: VOC family protein [Chloroflexi bacterium]|nr:VOC family protein [Chloroflexota bacterium]
MKLNHLNLAVTDVDAAHQFLTTYFDLQSMTGGNAAMRGLIDDNGSTLILMRSEHTDVHYPRSFHIGFTQTSEAEVDALNQRLRDAGFDVPAPRRLHGSWAFYFQAPGGFVIEVSC